VAGVCTVQRRRVLKTRGQKAATFLKPKFPRRESCGHKPSRHVEMVATKSALLRTQIMKVADIICVANFRDLCQQQSLQLCCESRGLCCKVGLMEFGLKQTAAYVCH